MLNKLISSIFLLFVANTVYSFELSHVTGTQTSIAYAGTTDTTKGRKHYESAKSVVAPAEVTGHIPFNKKVGILTFSVLVPQKSIIYMKWDNSDSLYSRIGKMVKFKRAGEYRSISFNATKLSSGYVYLYNANKKLLSKVHYTIKKQNAYSQNLRAYVRNTNSETSNNGKTGSNKSNYAGVGYSVSQRVNIGDPHLTMGLSLTTDLDNIASRTITASVGYSW